MARPPLLLQRSNNFGYEIHEIEVYGLREYAWTPNDGSINDTTSANPIFTPTTTTNYTLAIPDMCAGKVYYNYRVVVDCILLNQDVVELDGQYTDDQIHLFVRLDHTAPFHSLTLERSIDGINFDVIQPDILHLFHTNSDVVWVDKDISTDQKGYYYRIQCEKTDQSIRYTPMTYVSLPQQSTDFKLFPNPVKDHLQIHYPTKDDIHIRIIDQLGRCVYSLVKTVAPAPSEVL